MSVEVGAVILAAGFGRRFGSDKRLHPLPQTLDQDATHGGATITIVEATVANYADVFTHVRVVLRPGDTEVADRLTQFNVELIESEAAIHGMGHSLADGFKQLPWDWAFVALADMPYIQPGTLSTLRDFAKHRKTRSIIQPKLPDTHELAATKTHPVGWHADYFAEICNCRGDSGARALLRKYASDIVAVPCEDDGVGRDIDQPSDVQI